MDGIFHLIRAFDDAEIVHVEGDVDPVRDLTIIHEELRLKDQEFINKLVSANEKDVIRIGKGGNAADKEKKEQFETMKKVQDWVCTQKKDVRAGDWSTKEVELINQWFLLTAKPVVYLVNLSEKDYCRKKNKWLIKIKAWIDENHPGDTLIPFSGMVEMELGLKSTPEEKEDYLKSLTEKYTATVPVSSVLPKIVTSGYQALSLHYCN